MMLQQDASCQSQTPVVLGYYGNIISYPLYKELFIVYNWTVEVRLAGPVDSYGVETNQTIASQNYS